MSDFRSVFQQLPQPYILLDTQMKIVEANEEYLRVAQRNKSDIVGRNVFDLIPEGSDLSAHFRKSLDEVVENRHSGKMEIIPQEIDLPGQDAFTQYWEVTNTPILDEGGGIKYILCLAEDVTERETAKLKRKEGEEALKASEEMFRFMAESMPAMAWVSRPDGTAIFVSRRWQKYTGVPVEQMLTVGWHQAIHPDDLPNTISRLQECNQTGEDYQVEFRVKRHDGQYRWHLTRALARKDKQNNILMWIGSSTDIHDQRIMVEELLESSESNSQLADQLQVTIQAIEEEQKLLEDLLMNAPAMICILRGPQHRFDLVNPLYQQLFPQRQLLGKTVAEALPEVAEQGFIDLLDSVYQTGNPFTGDDVGVSIDRHNTGELEDIFVDFTYQPLYRGGKIDGIAVFAIDVTKQVMARKRLDELSSGNGKPNANA